MKTIKDAIQSLRLASSAIGKAAEHLESLVVERARRILIVEDDEDVRESLASVLRGRGYEVLLAPCGRIGLDSMRTQTPDVVLLDLMMSPVSGWDVLNEMAKDQVIAHTPILIITGSDAPAAPALRLQKPFSMEKLIEAVDRLCTLSHFGLKVPA